MPSIYNPVLGRYQDVSDADAQYLAKPLGGDTSGTRMLRNPLDNKLYPVSDQEYDFLSKPGRTLGDAVPMQAPATPPEDSGVEIADYAKSIMSGGASLAQGFGWLTRQVGADRIGSTIEELGRNAVDYWNDSLSDAAKDALSREFVRKNAETGEYEWGDPTLNTVGLMGAQSVLGTAAGMGVGAGVTKVLQLFANPLGRSVLASAAASGSIQAGRKLALIDRVLTRGVTEAVGAAKRLRAVDAVIGALGFGAGEGLVSAMQSGQAVEAAVKLLPPETLLRNDRYRQVYESTAGTMSELERHQYAADTVAKEAGSMAGWQSGLVTALLGAPMGAFFGRILGQSGRMASSRLAATALGAGGEAAQEAAQSAAESAIGVNARQSVGEQDLDMLESAINDAIGGAAAGGLLGGAVGAVDFKAEVPRGTSNSARRGGDKPPGETGGTTGVSTGAKPDTATPLKNAAMRAAQAGADREAVLAEVQANDRPLIDRIAKLNKLAAAASAAPPAAPAAPTYRDVLEPAATDAPPKPRTQPAPLDVTSPVDEIAHQAATSPLNPKPPPTPEQIDAENYEAARVPGKDVGLRTMDLVVEYPRGVQRGEVTMRNHYGRIPGTVGGDGMALDFFLGNEDTDTVYLYHTLDKAGRFAQHKALINMSREEADATLKDFYHRPPGPNGTLVELTKPEFEQWVAAGNLGAPHPKAGIEGARRFEGQPTRAVTAAGDAISARYALMEAGDLTASHTLTGKPNARFPQELQPRDRSRAGLRQWIVETAARFEPALATEGVSAAEGAPIVGPDGVIESGNGRMMLITKLYLDKNPAYRQYLEQNAPKFGFTKEQVDQLARPVLVRVRQDAMDMAARQRFATEANRPTLSTFSATEQANSDARTLTHEDLAAFAPAADGSVVAGSNAAFVRSFLQKMPATERAGLMTADGQPTRQLANRIQSAVFARAYQDDRLLALMAEEANPDVRNVVSALTVAAPAFARARAAGGLEQANVIEPLVQAVDLVRGARARGQSVEETLGQGGLFGATPPAVDRMARFIDSNIRSAKRMGEAFTALAQALESETLRRKSGSLFEEAPLDVGYAIEAANQRMRETYDAGEGQAALFSRGRQYPLADRGEWYGNADFEARGARMVRMSPKAFLEVAPPLDVDESSRDNIDDLKRHIQSGRSLDPLALYPDGSRTPADGRHRAIAAQELGIDTVPVLDFRGGVGTLYSKGAFVEGQRGWAIADVYEHALPNQAKLANLLDELAAAFGVKTKNPGIKERARLEEKFAKEGYSDIGEIVDVVRGAILADTVEQSEAIVDAIRAKMPVFDKGVQVTKSGYVDRKVLLRFEDGQVGEIQVAPPAIFAAKYERGGEQMYKEQRALENENGVVSDPVRYAQLRVQQVELYAHAVMGTPWEATVQAAGFADVNQVLNRLRQSASESTPASASTEDTLTAFQSRPGAGITNAASPPSASVPVTAGRSSNETKLRTDLTGSSTVESVARARVERVRQWIAPRVEGLHDVMRVTVVDDVSELPDPTAPPDVEGAYTQDRQVWLVAKNLPTEARTIEVLRHEAFGHLAPERLGKFKARLDAIVRSIRAGNLKPLVKEVRARQGLLPATIEAREVVALMAERGMKSPLMDSMRAGVREVGRDLGFDMPVDERELNALVRLAARDLRRDAAMMRDFRAARGLPAVAELEQAAEPTDKQILEALDEIYGPNEDLIDSYGGTMRRAPSGKLVPVYSRAPSAWYHGSAEPLTQDAIEEGEMYFTSDPEEAKFWGPNVHRAAVAPQEIKTLKAKPDGVDPVEYWDNIRGPEEWQGTHDAIRVTSSGHPDMLVVKDAAKAVTFYSRNQTSTPEFKAWFGDSKVVDENGEPLVVYHGTAGDFEAFDPNRAGVDSDLGAGLYFTNEPEDAANNYATTKGPDITLRYQVRVEDVDGSFDYDLELRNAVAEFAGKTIEELEENEIARDEAIQAFVRAEMGIAHEGLSMPVYLKMENPLVLGGPNETFLDFESVMDEEGEFTGDERGTLVDVVLALRNIAGEYGADVDLGSIMERAIDGGAKASEFFEAAKSALSFVEDNETGALVGNEIVRRAFEEAGFDGIIDHTVDVKFGSQQRVGRPMAGMNPDTTHYVVFRPEQVKSAIGNRGTFDPNDPRITYSRAGALPGAVPDEIQELLGRVMAPPSDAVTIKDKARELWRKLTDINGAAIRQGVIDSFDAIKQLEKGQFGAVLDAAESPYKAALATRNLPSVMAAVMMRGVPVYKDGAFQLKAGRKGIIEIFQPLTDHPDGNLLPLWELYAAASRERDVMRTKKDYTPLFSNAERLKALALAQQYPLLEQVSKDWEQFNGEVLDLAVERGVLDPEAVAAWKQSFYVPFYRAMEEAAAGGEGPGKKRGLEGHGGQAVKKRLRGSEKPLGHVFENLVMNTAYLIDESFKNTAMQKVAAMADGVAMERIPLKWDAVQLPAGQLEKALNELGGMVLGFKDDPTSPTGKSWQSGLTAAQREEWIKLFRRVAPVGKDVVSVFEGGKPVYYRVTDDLLLRSIGNMGYDNFQDVFGLFRGSKRLLTSAITMDPAFMAANWVRDTLSAWVTSDAGIKPVIDSLKGAKSAFTMDSDVLAMMAAGGGGGGIYDMQPAELRKFLVDKLGSASAANRFMGTVVSPKNWLRLWRKIGNAAENANRVAVYRAVRKAGGSVAEAAYQARDVLNFAMHGDYAAMRWLTATVPFMNARVQGLYRLWRGAQDNPGAFMLKGMMLMAATLALLLRNNDEEEYEQLSEWDKDMYWHFWLGGEHYRLPKPFEVGAIFGTIPERMYRLGTGRDSASIVKQRIMSMMADTFAFNPIPQVAKPLIEQYANRSFFFGSPIVGMAELNLAPEAQYTPWTSEAMKLMADSLPDWAPAWLRSPQRLEAMLRGYLGSTGTYALQAADTLARGATGAPPRPARNLYDAPVVKRFLQSPTPRYTKYADQLYDMLEEANAIFRTVNRYREQGRTADAQALIETNMGKLAARARLNRVATQVRSLNNQIQLVMYNPTMSPELKRERIDALTAKKNEVTALVAPLAEAF